MKFVKLNYVMGKVDESDFTEDEIYKFNVDLVALVEKYGFEIAGAMEKVPDDEEV